MKMGGERKEGRKEVPVHIGRRRRRSRGFSKVEYLPT